MSKYKLSGWLGLYFFFHKSVLPAGNSNEDYIMKVVSNKRAF